MLEKLSSNNVNRRHYLKIHDNTLPANSVILLERALQTRAFEWRVVIFTICDRPTWSLTIPSAARYTGIRILWPLQFCGCTLWSLRLKWIFDNSAMFSGLKCSTVTRIEKRQSGFVRESLHSPVKESIFRFVDAFSEAAKNNLKLWNITYIIWAFSGSDDLILRVVKKYIVILPVLGVRGNAVGWGTALKAGRSRVRFPT